MSNKKFVGIRSPHVSWLLPFRAFFHPSACLCFLIQRRFIQLFRGSTEELKKEEIPGEKSSHFILPCYVQFRYPLNDCIARITFKDKSNTQTMHTTSLFSTPGIVNEALWTERAKKSSKRYWKGWEKLLNYFNTDQTCLGYMHAKHMPGGMQRPWIESIGGFFFFHFFPFLDS